MRSTGTASAGITPASKCESRRTKRGWGPARPHLPPPAGPSIAERGDAYERSGEEMLTREAVELRCSPRLMCGLIRHDEGETAA